MGSGCSRYRWCGITTKAPRSAISATRSACSPTWEGSGSTILRAAMIRLNVNIDHIATIRQARQSHEPSLVAAAVLADLAGADGITIHLRGDRRHIQDRDVRVLRSVVVTHLNLEMAATDEMIGVAALIKPDTVTLVPERPGEV